MCNSLTHVLYSVRIALFWHNKDKSNSMAILPHVSMKYYSITWITQSLIRWNNKININMFVSGNILFAVRRKNWSNGHRLWRFGLNIKKMSGCLLTSYMRTQYILWHNKDKSNSMAILPHVSMKYYSITWIAQSLIRWNNKIDIPRYAEKDNKCN
jgi:hypothetical protein